MRARDRRSPIGIGMTATLRVCDLPAAPLSRNPLQVSRPEALRPRLATGLPLRCRHSDAPSQSTPQAPVCTDGGWFAVYLSRVSAVTPIVKSLQALQFQVLAGVGRFL